MNSKIAPRRLNHSNKSNPSLSWGDKYEAHTQKCYNLRPMNCIIGDSTFERLSRPRLYNLFQEYIPRWTNLGIGGDRIENIAWRIRNGGFPMNPRKVILCGGSNNLTDGNSKRATEIADMLLDTVSYLINTYKDIELAVMGIPPRQNWQMQSSENNKQHFEIQTSIGSCVH